MTIGPQKNQLNNAPHKKNLNKKSPKHYPNKYSNNKNYPFGPPLKYQKQFILTIIVCINKTLRIFLDWQNKKLRRIICNLSNYPNDFILHGDLVDSINFALALLCFEFFIFEQLEISKSFQKLTLKLLSKNSSISFNRKI